MTVTCRSVESRRSPVTISSHRPQSPSPVTTPYEGLGTGPIWVPSISIAVNHSWGILVNSIGSFVFLLPSSCFLRPSSTFDGKQCAEPSHIGPSHVRQRWRAARAARAWMYQMDVSYGCTIPRSRYGMVLEPYSNPHPRTHGHSHRASSHIGRSHLGHSHMYPSTSHPCMMHCRRQRKNPH